jgi:hypothetical protein
MPVHDTTKSMSRKKARRESCRSSKGVPFGGHEQGGAESKQKHIR